MTDFLATLAARIRPAAPPIEPRRAAIFESPARETPPVETAAETACTLASPAPPNLPPASTQTPNLPGPQFQPTPVSVLPLSLAPAVAAPGILPSPPPAPALLFEPVRVVSVPEKPASPPAEKKIVPSREAPAAPPPNFDSPIHSILTEKTISVPVPSPIVPAHIQSREPPPPPRTGPLLAPPVVQLIEPAPRPSATPAPGSASAEPPVIRVTIGRVEVRAIMAPAPQQVLPPATKKSIPVISLEDYLKQQSSRRAHA